MRWHHNFSETIKNLGDVRELKADDGYSKEGRDFDTDEIVNVKYE